MSHRSTINELDHKIQRAKETLFTGVLAIGTSGQMEWFLYFLVGQIVWANARDHSKRRWHRQFLKYSSHLSQRTLHEIAHQAQNYQTVAQLVMNQKFSREQFSKIVRGCIAEVLFDTVQAGTLASRTIKSPLTYKVSSRNGANFPCIGLNREPIWDQVQQDWQDWQQANLVDYRPNSAPLIVQPDLLQERIPADKFEMLTHLANGNQTLRDLAVKTQQPLAELTQSLVPHIRRELIKLVSVDDLAVKPHFLKSQQPEEGLPLPRVKPAKLSARKSASRPTQPVNYPVVIYIDDNPADSRKMADIFQDSGYRYVNIANPLKAIPQLIEIKPQLIFLDLVMPVVNGYELCAQIRRVSLLKDIPIIIMTNNDGIPDRVRAKVVGANGFLGKPIKAKKVLKVIIKHLQSNSKSVSHVPVRQSNFTLSPSVS
ncbi:MAG: response regulator [Cyanobacteria bacterium P01_C01_bin.118]